MAALFLIGIIVEWAIIAVASVIESNWSFAGRTGTYFVIFHPRYLNFAWTLSLAFPLFYWAWPRLAHRALSTRLAIVHFCLTMVFFNIVYFSIVVVATIYARSDAGVTPPSPATNVFRLVAQGGFVGLLAAQLLFIYNAFLSFRDTNRHVANR